MLGRISSPELKDVSTNYLVPRASKSKGLIINGTQKLHSPIFTLKTLIIKKYWLSKNTLKNCEIVILHCKIRCEKYITKTKHMRDGIVIISSIASGFQGLQACTFGVDEKHFLFICITYILLCSFVERFISGIRARFFIFCN